MDIILSLHGINRWLFLLLGLYAITKAALGLMKHERYDSKHKASAVLFLGVTHLQALLGLILYFGRGWHWFLPNIGEYMKNPMIRFWTIEHIFGMLVAVVLIQVGRIKSKKAVDDSKKFKLAFSYFTVALIIVLATIPWPFREAIGRPLWP